MRVQKLIRISTTLKLFIKYWIIRYIHLDNNYIFNNKITYINISKMQERYIKRKINFSQQLSPWGNQQKQQNSMTIDIEIRPRQKKMKDIQPRLKATSQRKIAQKNPVKIYDYQLPPLNKISSRIKQQHTMTLSPNAGRLIKNISSHRLNSIQNIQVSSLDKQSYRFKLSGKKYYMVPQEKCQKINSFYSKTPSYYLNNNTPLIFARNKDDILKKVLNQIQGRIKQLGV